MYQKNPLLESRNHFLKILKRYTPEERKRIMNRLIELGKENGGKYSVDEYGKRMYNGERKRIQKIASKYGFKPVVIQNNTGKADTLVDGDSIIINVPGIDNYPLKRINADHGKFFKKQIKDDGHTKSSIKKFQKFNRRYANDKVSKPLNAANILAHEGDEAELTLRLIKNQKDLTPKDIDIITSYLQRNTTGIHQLGVLSREAKRQHILNTLYGKGTTQQIPRTHKDFKTNNSKFNPKLKDIAKNYFGLNDI